MSNTRNSTRPMLAPGSRKRSGSTTDDYQPTTPRLNARFSDHPAEEILAEESTSNTPTRGTFKFPADNSIGSEQHGDNTGVTRENSRRSVHSHQSSDSHTIKQGRTTRATTTRSLQERRRRVRDSTAPTSHHATSALLAANIWLGISGKHRLQVWCRSTF